MRRMPDLFGRLGFPTGPGELLAAVGVMLVSVALLSATIGTCGRWCTALARRRLPVTSCAGRSSPRRCRLPLPAAFAPISRADLSISCATTWAVRPGCSAPWSSSPGRPSCRLLRRGGGPPIIEWRAVAVVAVILLPLAYIPQRLWIRRMRPGLAGRPPVAASHRRARRRGIRRHPRDPGIRSPAYGGGARRPRSPREPQAGDARLVAGHGGRSRLVAAASPGRGGRGLVRGQPGTCASASSVATGALDPAKAFTTGNLVMFPRHAARAARGVGGSGQAAPRAVSPRSIASSTSSTRIPRSRARPGRSPCVPRRWRADLRCEQVELPLSRSPPRRPCGT